MGGQYGVKNLLPLILLGVEMGNVGDKMGRSKGIARYAHLLDLMDEVMQLPKVDFAQVKLEVKELDEADRAELKAQVKAKLDLVDDVLESALEDSLSIVEAQYQVVEKSISLYKSLKKEA